MFVKRIRVDVITLYHSVFTGIHFSENMQEHCSYAFSIEMFHSNGDEVEFLTANMKSYIGENASQVFILRLIRISELLLIERNKYPELKGGPNKKILYSYTRLQQKNKI